MKLSIWLVEIRLKNWKPDLKTGGRTLTYEEVEAFDNVHARHVGYAQFLNKCNYAPITRRKMATENLMPEDLCAPDAVELD